MLDVLLVQPNRIPKAVHIKHDLQTLQWMVGGTITAIYPFEDDVAIIATASCYACRLTVPSGFPTEKFMTLLPEIFLWLDLVKTISLR